MRKSRHGRPDGRTYRHGKQTGLVVLQVEVLVGELGRAVDACAPRPVAVQEIAALAHESLDLHVMNPLAPLYSQTSSRFCFDMHDCGE